MDGRPRCSFLNDIVFFWESCKGLYSSLRKRPVMVEFWVSDSCTVMLRDRDFLLCEVLLYLRCVILLPRDISRLFEKCAGLRQFSRMY